MKPISIPTRRRRPENENELSLWRESHRANIACRDAIEDTIRRSFDGMHLDKDCITPVLDEYGYKRTGMVLANTLHELQVGRAFQPANKQWLSGATFRRMSVTMLRSLFGATPPCWMASSVSTARRCRR